MLMLDFFIKLSYNKLLYTNVVQTLARIEYNLAREHYICISVVVYFKVNCIYIYN